MTISTTATRAAYTGNGVTTIFSIPFAYRAVGEIAVYLDGVLQSVGYTVSAAPAASGTVTFSSAPATGVAVVITRSTAMTQQIDYVANDPFAADVTEGGFDRAMLAIQDNAASVARSLRAADHAASVAALDLTSVAGKWVRVTAGGDGFEGADAITVASEYGTWIPELRFGGASTGITYTRQQGIYLAQGRRVSGVFEMLLSSKGSATGVTSIAGLPYPGISWGTGPQYQSAGVIAAYDGMTSIGYPPAMINVLSELYLYIYSATTTGNMQDTNFTNTSRLRGHFSYIKAA